MSSTFDLNLILIPIVVALSLMSFVSGIFLVLRSFLNFRSQINRSMNMDVEIVRVAKAENKSGEKGAEAWKEEIGSMEQFISSLSILKEASPIKRFFYGAPRIAFEIAKPANNEEIFFYMSVPKKYREAIDKQVHSYFPDSSIEKVSDYTIFSPGGFTAATVLKLKKNFSLPIRTYETMDIDPLNQLSNAMSKLDTAKEGAAIQLVLRPAGKEWRKVGKAVAHNMQQGKQLKNAKSNSLVGDLAKGIGEEASKALINSPEKKETPAQDSVVQLTSEEQELVKEIERKSSKAGFKVDIRIIASAETQQKADEILSHLESSFSQFERHDSNHFVVKKRVKSKNIAFDYIFRNFRPENKILLNVEEIASIFHFPISTTETPKIKWLKSGAAPPPTNIPQDGISIGFNDYRGTVTDIKFSTSDRRRHLYTIGQTGTGKSEFLKGMAKQDVKNGKGVCIIDPHGDFAEDVLAAVPKERAEDVIYFDPSDTERPLGLNMLEYEKPEEKTFVINEVLGIFDKLYDLKATGGPMFEQYMRNAMLLIMDDPESGSTLLEISKVLSDEDFRKMKISKCKNPVVVEFWTKEAEKAGGEAALVNMVPYITSKLTTFISNDMMRPIIAQQKSTLNFREIMDKEKILIINLAKGKIGEINANLLGMVIVGKLLMAALSRTDIPEDERKDFYLYMDEFQNITTDSISQILSEARKYRLALIMAHQFIAQLSENTSKAVFGNVGSMVAFRVGAEDAEFLEKQYEPVFKANDLMNVDNYNCFARLMINNESSKPFSLKTNLPTKGDQETANYMKELSRLKYGRDANIINREIMERAKSSNIPGEGSKGVK